MIVIAGELTLGVLQGIALGRARHRVVDGDLDLPYQPPPRGAARSTSWYRDVELHPDALRFPGLLIWRIGGDLFFASIGHTSATLKESLSARPDVKRLLLDFAPVNFIDISAADGLLQRIPVIWQHSLHVCNNGRIPAA
jgi:MFS superfamily sulfate permease-like transporter